MGLSGGQGRDGMGLRSISTDKTCDVIRRVIKGGGVDGVQLLAHLLSTNMNDGDV